MPLVGRESVLHGMQDALRSGKGVLIVGAPGMGKTALATAALEAAGGYHVVNLHGTPVSRKTSYGAMAWLITELPASAKLHPVQVLQQLRVLLRQKANGLPVLICVDDAEELDDLSALVVSQLARGGDATVIATVQDILLAAPDLISLWSDGYLQRTDLEALDQANTHQLMEQTAGGPVSERARAAMWTETRGSPQFTILMTLEQIKSRRLVRSEGVWVMAAPYIHTGAIAELISARLSGLSSEERKVVEILSFTVSLPLKALLELAAPDVLDTLEESGTVELTGCPVPTVRIRNATLAAVVAENVPLGRSHQLWKEVSAVLGSSDGLDPVATTGYASWSLACGAQLDGELVLRAAKAANARGDNAGALLYIRSVAAEGRSQELVCEEVSALTLLGENQLALSVLQHFEPGFDVSRSSWVELMLQKAGLLRSLPKAGSAQSVLDSLRGNGAAGIDGTHPRTPSYHADTEASIVLAQAHAWLAEGDYTQSVEPLLALARQEGTAPGLRALAAAMSAEALSVTGRAGEAMAMLEDFWPLIMAPQTAPDQAAVLTRLFYAFYAAGELERAREMLRAAEEQNEQGFFRGNGGELADGFLRVAAGEGEAALESLLPAVGQLRYHDPENLLPLAAALMAYAYALSGDPEQAAAYTALAPRFRHRPLWYARQTTTYFRVLAEESEPPEANSRRLFQLAEDALELGNVSFALSCLERAVTLGDNTAAMLLVRTAEGASGRWAEVLAWYGRGLTEGNPGLLLEAARGAQELGQHPLAHHAARLVRTAADTVPRSMLRAAAAVENAAFRQLRRENSLEQKLGELSEFDAGLVRLAAGKLTRTQIAEELHLSPRTVDWHLGKLFDKLHVSGRDELRDVLR